jgi:hypothetical protein
LATQGSMLPPFTARSGATDITGIGGIAGDATGLMGGRITSVLANSPLH